MYMGILITYFVSLLQLRWIGCRPALCVHNIQTHGPIFLVNALRRSIPGTGPVIEGLLSQLLKFRWDWLLRRVLRSNAQLRVDVTVLVGYIDVRGDIVALSGWYNVDNSAAAAGLRSKYCANLVWTFGLVEVIKGGETIFCTMRLAISDKKLV
jgi:hypothetical protein